MNRRSAYMEWAKLRSSARFNLATSGIMSVPAAEFPMPNERLEITAPGAYGYPPLQERIAQHAGVPVECVVAAAGTSMANHLALAAVLEPGDEVLLERPNYGLLLDLARYFGAEVRRFERRAEDDFALTLDEISQRITAKTKVIALTNLHNPSGSLTSNETLRALAGLAQTTGAYILLDEVYLEMLPDRPASFATAPFLTTNSLTKGYGLSGLRCGWVIAEPAQAERMWRLNDLFGANAAHPAEQLSVLAFDHLESFRARANRILAANRPLLETFLDSREDLTCFRPPAGTVFFPRLRRGQVESLVRLLREKYETSVVPGSFFEAPQHFRLGLGGPTEELRAGLERLGAALDEFGRTNL